MGPAVAPAKPKPESLTDEEVVSRVRAGETALYEVIMRRYNQRLYRIARAILHSDAEAEDVMQDAYVRAYEHLDQFTGPRPICRLVDPHRRTRGLARLRLSNRSQSLDDNEYDGELSMQMT